METALVRVDSKFRIVIPKRLRKSVGVLEKTNMYIYAFENFIFLRKADFDKCAIIESIRNLKCPEDGGDAKG